MLEDKICKCRRCFMCDFPEYWKLNTCHCCGERMGQVTPRIIEKTGKKFKRIIEEKIE